MIYIYIYTYRIRHVHLSTVHKYTTCRHVNERWSIKDCFIGFHVCLQYPPNHWILPKGAWHLSRDGLGLYCRETGMHTPLILYQWRLGGSIRLKKTRVVVSPMFYVRSWRALGTLLACSCACSWRASSLLLARFWHASGTHLAGNLKRNLVKCACVWIGWIFIAVCYEMPSALQGILSKPFHFTRDLREKPCEMQWF